jgi:hypothetical protein
MADRINPFDTRNAPSPRIPNHTYLATSQGHKNPKLVDEVIAHLANAPENRRARQIGEWERLQKNSFRLLA